MNIILLIFGALLFSIMILPVTKYFMGKQKAFEAARLKKEQDRFDKQKQQIAAIQRRYSNIPSPKPSPQKATPMFHLDDNKRKWLMKMQFIVHDKYVEAIDQILLKGYYDSQQKRLLNTIRKEYIHIQKRNKEIDKLHIELNNLAK